MRALVGRAIPIIIGVLVFGCSGSTGPSKLGAGPLAVVSLDTAVAYSGAVANIKLRIDWPSGQGSQLDSMGGFDFLICYDKTALQPLQPVKADSSISQWEYFTYRTYRTIFTESESLGTIQIVAQRDLDNGVSPSPAQLKPSGTLAKLSFQVASDRTLIGTVPQIGFWFSECRDNTIHSEGDRDHLYRADTSLGRNAFKAGFDTMNCPRAYALSPVLEFWSGWVRIAAPLDDRDSVIIVNPGSRDDRKAGRSGATR